MIGGWLARESELNAQAQEIVVLRAKVAQLEADAQPAGPLTYCSGYDEGYAQGYADGQAKDDPNA